MKASTGASLPTILLVTAIAFFAPQNAPAEESGADPWTDRWLALEIHGGLGTPHGFGGLALDLTPARFFSFNLGAGMGIDGIQVQLSTRWRIPFDEHGVGVSVGTSFGDSDVGDLVSTNIHLGNAVWVNSEVFYEHRWEAGLLLRAYVGLGVKAWAETCRESSFHNEEDRECGAVGHPYVGLAAGWAF